jgi:hypothetical protein
VKGVDAPAAARQAGRYVVNVTGGDMADVSASGPFAVAYLVFSTLSGLLLRWRAECFR